ncbi:MAG: DUF2723 domain-containing protein [Candidatus Aegiribacteria sp.]|nr:DUF2723 domain-containing protein [Candidatus Aegiribacteria sp.]
MTYNIDDIKRIRIDRIISVLVGLAALITYLITLAPSVSFWDSGEYLTCSWTAGVPHPPGVPLFVLLGRFSTILFSFIPAIAVRVNLLCAFAGAFTLGIMTRLVQRWGNRMGFSPSWYRPMSVLAGLIAAFSYSIWRNSNATETYATALLLTFIIMWAFDCWIEKYAEKKHEKGKKDHGGWGEARYFLLISYLLILAVGNHGSVPFVTGPPILLMFIIYAFRKKTDIWKRSWFVLTIAGLVLLAFSIHLYMPIRAIQNPEINETDAEHWSNFERAFTREQYGSTSILDRKGPFLDQMKLYMKYLSWQSGRVDDGWDRYLGGTAGSAASMVMKIILIFGAIYGLVVLGIKRPKLLLYLGALFLMSSILFIFFILNFKTGLEATSLGEVRERDYFFGASFALFAIFSGIGLVSVFKDFLSERSRLVWLTLLVPMVSFGVNFYRCDRSNSYFAHDYGINLLESCPPNAVLITNGDNDTFPLWFAQGVLGVRRDVIVSNLSLMNTNWYVQQLVEKDPLLLSFDDLGLIDSLHPVYIWGPHYFHVGRNGSAESSPIDGEILRTTFDQVWPWAIIDGEMAIALHTEGLANQGALSMQDLVLLNMIKNKPVHGREIYFAGTVAPESRQFLEHYQEMEGIAFRITDYPVVDAVNSARGWQLLESYRFTGVTDPSVYKCNQAVQLLKNYVSAYHRLAHQYLAMGEPDSVRLVLERAEQLFITLPDDWAEVLPSRAMIVGKLIDGLYGPQAASDTLLALADQSLNAARETGNQELMQLSLSIASMATSSDDAFGYRRKMEYRNLFDAIDNGSIPFAWMRIEVSLMFSDFIGAWNVLDSIEITEAPHSAELDELAWNTLEYIMENSRMGFRVNIYDTGLYLFFESIGQNVSSDLELGDNTNAGTIIAGMIELASREHIMSSVSAGLVLSEYISDQDEARIVADFAYRLLEDDPEVTRKWTEWYMIEDNRVSPEALAWMAAKGGRYFLVYAALSRSSNVSESTLSEILSDPASYAASIPDPGRGAGRYSWVNSLYGGS